MTPTQRKTLRNICAYNDGAPLHVIARATKQTVQELTRLGMVRIVGVGLPCITPAGRAALAQEDAK